MCQTVFTNKSLLVHKQIVALTFTDFIIAFANVSVNLLLIYGLLKLRLIKTISYKFILFLCISDCCIGLIPQMLLACVLLITGDHSCVLKIITQSFQVACCQFSVIMILIITMDRFLHMNYLTKYNVYMTKNRAFSILAINIIICMLTVIANVLASIYNCYFIVHTTILGLNATVILFICGIYAKTYWSIRNRVKGIRLDSEMSSILRHSLLTSNRALAIIPSKFIQRRQQYHLNFAKAMILVLLTLGLCYTPYLTVVCMVTYAEFEGDKTFKVGDVQILILYWSVLLMYINSFFNGIILVFSNKRIRRFIKERIWRGAVTQDTRRADNAVPMATLSRRNTRRNRVVASI